MATQTPIPQVQSIGETQYRRIPWLRKSGTNSMFILLHVLTLGTVPFLLITCIVLATGNIYYNKLGPDGTLMKWSTANKVVAWLLLLPWILFVVALLVALVAGLVREMFT
jgi:hypothetical protein